MCSIGIDCWFDYKRQLWLRAFFLYLLFFKEPGNRKDPLDHQVQSSAVAGVYLLPKLIKQHHKSS